MAFRGRNGGVPLQKLNIRSAKIEEKEEDIPKEYEDFNDQVFNKAIFKKLPDQSK